MVLTFEELKKPVQIFMAKKISKNGTFIEATRIGWMNVAGNEGVPGVLEKVLYCPEVPHNLLSVK